MDKRYFLYALTIGLFAMVSGPLLVFMVIGSDPALLLALGPIFTFTLSLSAIMTVAIAALIWSIIRGRQR